MTHAILSPSSASRWLACTPSARLEQQFPDTSGDAAKEGTVAHTLGELLLREFLGLVSKPIFNRELFEIKQSEYYSDAMHEYAEDYKAFVLERFSEAKSRTSDAVLFLEHRLDMTEYVPEGFGTGDTVIVADGTLDIIDLKYGKGVLVSAIENKQMMLYALGALKDFSFLYDIHTVRMTIYQPRLDNFSTFEMSVSELYKWAESELKEKAQLAFEGKGEQVPGKHCGFCKVKPRCKALADYNLELAKHDFAAPLLLEDSAISVILSKLDLLTDWAGAIKKHALDQALQGKKWEGFKLVEGRSVRKFTNEDEAAKTLIKAGWPEDSIYNKKIVGIGAIEKLIGKKGVEEKLGKFIEKPAGAPTLVPSTDKRPEFNSAISDFQSIS